jgi:hypothetical protein
VVVAKRGVAEKAAVAEELSTVWTLTVGEALVPFESDLARLAPRVQAWVVQATPGAELLLGG